MKRKLSFALGTLALGIFVLQAATNTAANGAAKISPSTWAFINSAQTNRVLRIGLVDCIAWTMQNNSEIMIKKIEPKLKEDDRRIAESKFEPVFSANAILDVNKSPVPMPLNVYSSSVSKVAEVNAGISGKLKTGTRYELDLMGSRTDANPAIRAVNPVYFAEPELTITQPLFRGAGFEVNEAEIHIAANIRRISAKSLRSTAMETISRTLSAYYNYCYALEYKAITDAALKRARDLYTINQERYAKGIISSVELLETDTSVAKRVKDVISAEAIVAKTEDDLKMITNLIDDPNLWMARIEVIDRPAVELRKIDLTECLTNAFSFRPDYQMKLIELQNNDIAVKVARNSLLPTVDLAGSYGMNGWGADYGDALNTVTPENNDWTVWLRFSKPWGGGERAAYDQKKLEKMRGLMELKRLEQKIILDIRDRIRAVETQRKQMEAAKHSKDLELKNFEAQKERYAAGQVSTHNMLDYQERVATSETEYLKTLVDYQTALITLDNAEGVTLAKNNIVLEE
jgi:outer membrane protein TolC